MNQQPVVNPAQLISVLVKHPLKWLVPTLVIGGVALAYALVRPAVWEASQALIIRDEAATDQERVGRFSRSDDMKSAQETILELLNSRGVLEATLKEVGPPADYDGRGVWPSDRDIAKMRKSVELTPPNGAEFGTTEVFYLNVKGESRDRAVELASVLTTGLSERFQQLLDDRAASVIGEVEKTVALAEADLDESSSQLAKLEQSVGGDLAELRTLHESPGGSSDLRQEVVAVDTELRQAQTDRRGKAELLALLQAGQSDPGRLVALPSRLLESHATMNHLIEGLNSARLNTCSLLGRMSADHPLVGAAKAEEDAILEKLTSQWHGAIQTAETEMRLADARVASLEAQVADIEGRFDRLAGLRSQYANLIDQSRTRTALLDTARHTLADARSSQAAARAGSLIDLIGTPDPGIYPIGPSRIMIVLVGLFGGVLAGFGVLAMTVAPPQSIPSQPAHSEPVSAEPEPPQAVPAQSVPPRPAAKQPPARVVSPAAVAKPAVVRPKEEGLSLKQALHKAVYGHTA